MSLPLILGLNPAWQRLFHTGKVQPGAVHRLTLKKEFASGKGINVVRILSKLGIRSSLVQFTGGRKGQILLQELHDPGVTVHSITIQSETRVCTTITDEDGLSSEFIEPSPIVTPLEVESFYRKLLSLWERHDRIVLSGTAPTGFDFEALGKLPMADQKIYVDSVQIPQGWLRHGLHLLKVNVDELRKLLGKPSHEPFHYSWGALALQQFSTQILVVTQGPANAWAFTGNDMISSTPPPVEHVVNTIGAGDAFLAAWISGEERKMPLQANLDLACRISSKRCKVELPWDLEVV